MENVSGTLPRVAKRIIPRAFVVAVPEEFVEEHLKIINLFIDWLTYQCDVYMRSEPCVKDDEVYKANGMRMIQFSAGIAERSNWEAEKGRIIPVNTVYTELDESMNIIER